jgi:hypothetical protein
MTAMIFPDGAWNDVRHGLFDPTTRYAGDDWAGEVLQPWLAAHQPIVQALQHLGRSEMASVALRVEDSWTLYAFSRVAEWLLLSYQPRAADPDDADDGLPMEAYEQFVAGIGATFPRVTDFHPFLHEIVAVQPDDDPQAAPVLTALWWPGCMIGSLMLQRAGVTVRAGANHLQPHVAAGSALYWSWRRQHRPAVDLSHDWGSNSQWRTKFRRDYWLSERLAFNVDAELEPAEDHRGGAPTDDSLELLGHRCSVLIDQGEDQWPWDNHYSEPAPRSFASAPPMVGYLAELTTMLLDLNQTGGIWDLADERMATGNEQFVADFAIMVRQRYGAVMPPAWQYGNVYQRLLRLLCTTAGPAAIEQAARVATSFDLSQRREAAQLLAGHQAAQDLTVLFSSRFPATAEVEELRALVVHELGLRGVDVSDLTPVAEWATSPERTHHPSTWLPQALAAMARGQLLPRLYPDLDSYYAPHLIRNETVVIRTTDARVPEARETTTAATAAAMSTAVAHWVSGSNGQCEARTFELAEELADEALADTLVSLQLHCVGTTTAADLRLVESSPGRAWHELLDAAVGGGAYTQGDGDVQGRLSAWLAVAALAGTSMRADVTDVERIARRCSWYSFNPSVGWFDRSGWDIAIVTLTPDRRRLAVLAATDAD